MSDTGLYGFIDVLEKNEELVRITDFVDPYLEISEITDRFSKQQGGGRALLFENNGTDFPVLINALGSERRIALAFGRSSVRELEMEIEELFRDFMKPRGNLWEKLSLIPQLKEVSDWMPRKIRGKGKCQEMVMEEPDLGKLPVLTCWPADGGPFITFPGVHTKDPETGAVNLGMYRMQVLDKKSTGMHWHKHKTGANHFEKYRKLGKKMPVSVALGGDLVYTYAATAPMPENVDEYLLAGFLRKKPVRLVKCLTNDLYVPEDSDFVIEGYVDPTEEMVWEGPFGDHTGFYSLADWYPKFHVTCITHKKGAVYPATIVGVPPMEDAYIGLATERIFLAPIRFAMIPELKNMALPVAGVAHNFAVVSIEKQFPGQGVKVMNSLWGAGQMMFNKVLVVVDDDVNIHDHQAILSAFKERFHPDYSLHFSKGPLDVLDHASSNFAFGSKVGIDLTRPFPEEMPQNKRDSETLPLDLDQLNNLPMVSDRSFINLDPDSDVLLLSVKKEGNFSKEKLMDQIISLPGISAFSFILLFNDGADLKDPFMLFWLLGGNLEPDRDITLRTSHDGSTILFVDATFKTTEHDRFRRDWPNVVTMDNKTIRSIDEKWADLGLGEFIESPSLRFKPLVLGEGAVRGND